MDIGQSPRKTLKNPGALIHNSHWIKPLGGGGGGGGEMGRGTERAELNSSLHEELKR